ncbi:MAG: hypothetical protein CMD29_05480 [Flavobacteriales bacterium]|nr:hypothetical protein [Flavobacteriales bacterium]|tara:strand:- start:740 stop:1498 length:759 start_codon:yes stop_codon:yes gene_type:complete
MKKILKKILPPKILIIIIQIYLKILPYTLVGFFLNHKMKNIKIEKFLIKFPKISNKDMGKYFFNVYENNERRLVKTYLDSNSSVLELGGCVGVVSNVINNILENKSNHVVLEANSNLVPFLAYNRKINKAQYQILNVILSKKKESAFYISKNILSSSGSFNKHLEKKVVKCMNFDQIQSKYSITFDTIIMDIEGGEYEVLKVINYNKLKLLIVEFHPNILGNKKILELKKVLKDNSFILKESLSNVDVWKKN